MGLKRLIRIRFQPKKGKMYSGGSDLQIRGGGGGMERGYGHPDPEISGGLVSNKFFSAFRSSI